MLEQHSTLRALLRKYCGPASLATAALLLVGSAAWADDKGNKGNEAGDDRAVRLIDVIPVPGTTANATNGKLYSYDISWVDQKNQLYFLADRSNAVVDVVDAKTDTFMGQIPGGFAGVGLVGGVVSTAASGPNGVVTGGHCLFVTDFKSGSGGRVVSFDLNASFPPPVVSSVFTGGTARADELAFDPKDNLLLVINNADTPPFGTFVKVTPSSCVLTPPTSANKVNIDTAHGVDAENGAEQPVWDGDTGLFYLSIPQIGATVSHGGVVSIPPNGTKYTVLGKGIDFCGPAGLALGPKGDLFVGCNAVFDTAGKVWSATGTVTAAPNDVIIDAKDGSINARVLGVGAGDEVWFNAGDGNYYATGSGSPFRPIDVVGTSPIPQTAQGSTPLGVVDAKDQKVLQQVTTFNVPAVGTGNSSTQHPAGTAHSVAANSANNRIFVPLGANNAFSAFAVPNGGSSAKFDCETGCIAVYAHNDEDKEGGKKED
jgi:hypothetical protein